MNRHLKVIIRFCFGVALLLLLFRMVEWKQVLPLFRTIQWSPFFLSMALYPVSILISALKWKTLLRPHGITVDSYELFRHYWTGTFFSNFLPSSVGGDVTRVVLLTRFGRPAEVAASVLFDRLTGVLVLLFVAISSSVHKPELFLNEWSPLFGAVSFSLAGGLLVVFFCSGYITARFRVSPVQHGGWYRLFLAKLKKLATAISLYRTMPKVANQAIAFSVVFYLLSVLGNCLSFQIFSVDVNPFDIFFITCWISLISFIPVSLNGLGMTEGAFVFFYGMVGVTLPEALAVALFIRFGGLICSAVGGLFLLFYGGHSSPSGWQGAGVEDINQKDIDG